MLRIYDLRAPLASRASLSLEYNLDAMQNKSCPSSRAPASPIHRRNSSSSGDRSSLSDDEDRHSSKGASVAAFSPDDVCIAIGRENNVAQVLDSRFVREEILVCRHEAQHSGENVGDGGAGGSDPTFGITALDWIDAAGGPKRSKNVLATGGDDGALDPTRQSTVVAQFSYSPIYAQAPSGYGTFGARGKIQATTFFPSVMRINWLESALFT